MAQTSAHVLSASHTHIIPGDTTHQAFQLLHVGYVALPLIAGLDKFFFLLTNWDQYLSPTFASMLPATFPFMLLVGIVEIAAAFVVAFKPRIGAYVVALWLWAIIINLLSLGNFYDIALRDFGLSIGALALARLSVSSDTTATE